MNVHQHVLPNTTTTTIPNVSILGIQAMNPNIGYTTILVNYQKTWDHNLLHQLYQEKPVCYLLQRTQYGITSYPLLCL
jgi:hypothetical protein